MATKRLELSLLLAVGIAPFYLNGFYNAPLAQSSHSAFWAVDVFTWTVMPIALFWIGHRRGLFTASELGLTTKIRGRERPLVFIALFIAVPILMFAVDVTTSTWAWRNVPPGWALPNFSYARMVPPPGPDTGWWRLLALVHFTVTAGVVEELYYRAAFDRLFCRGVISGAVFVLTSSFIFAGAHWEGGLPNMTEACAVGLFAAVVYRGSGNLWPLILGHILTDAYWFLRMS